MNLILQYFIFQFPRSRSYGAYKFRNLFVLQKY